MKPVSVQRPSADASLAWRVATLIFLFGAFHLAYAAQFGLAGDEAYYWQWSRQPAWGYFDHPPMVAWLIALGTRVAGLGEFGVRWPFVLMSIALLFAVYRLTIEYRLQVAANDDLSPERAGAWAVLAIAVMPLFNLGALLATPDVPMVLFSTLGVLLALRVARRPNAFEWLLLGATCGLAVLGKYPGGITPFALLLAFVSTRRGRELLRTPGPYLSVGAALLVLAPHLRWLDQNEYVSVYFQLGHGLASAGPGRSGPQFGTFLQFILGQLGVITPVLLVLGLGALFSAFKASPARPGARDEGEPLARAMLSWPAALALLLFALASFFSKSQTNWTAAAYPLLAAVLGPRLARMWDAAGWRKWTAAAGVGLAGLVSAYAHIELVHPLLVTGSSVFDKVQDKTGLARWVQSQRVARDPAAVVWADNYRTASLLAFYLPDHPRTDAPREHGSGEQYTLWRRAAGAPPGDMAWYVTRFADDPAVRELFADIHYVGDYAERRAGAVISHQRLYYGRRREPGGNS